MSDTGGVGHNRQGGIFGAERRQHRAIHHMDSRRAVQFSQGRRSIFLPSTQGQTCATSKAPIPPVQPVAANGNGIPRIQHCRIAPSKQYRCQCRRRQLGIENAYGIARSPGVLGVPFFRARQWASLDLGPKITSQRRTPLKRMTAKNISRAMSAAAISPPCRWRQD
jgi:hypothetical protein